MSGGPDSQSLNVRISRGTASEGETSQKALSSLSIGVVSFFLRWSQYLLRQCSLQATQARHLHLLRSLCQYSQPSISSFVKVHGGQWYLQYMLRARWNMNSINCVQLLFQDGAQLWTHDYCFETSGFRNSFSNLVNPSLCPPPPT